MKRKIIYFVTLTFLPVILGSIVGFATKDFMDYDTLVKPPFSPPSLAFPIAWTVLYLLMGISSYLIFNSIDEKKNKALTIYFIQLFINLLWSFLFFVFKVRLFAFIWLLLLIIMVIIMLYKFYKIKKLPALILLPYLLWLIFAAYLNLGVYLLNNN